VVISRTFAAIYEQQFPLPHYCGIVNLPDVTSGMILEQHSDLQAQQLWQLLHCNVETNHCTVGVTAATLAKLPIPQRVIQNGSP
jgi:hypothetical protein